MIAAHLAHGILFFSFFEPLRRHFCVSICSVCGIRSHNNRSTHTEHSLMSNQYDRSEMSNNLKSITVLHSQCEWLCWSGRLDRDHITHNRKTVCPMLGVGYACEIFITFSQLDWNEITEKLVALILCLFLVIFKFHVYPGDGILCGMADRIIGTPYCYVNCILRDYGFLCWVIYAKHHILWLLWKIVKKVL